MIGTKLYQKKARVYFFLLMYGILAIAGGFFAALSLSRNQSPSGAIGFMVIFGAGMFVMTLVKSRRPQVSVYEDDLELNQSRAHCRSFVTGASCLSRSRTRTGSSSNFGRTADGRT